ncbi:MAG: rhodanese-like domain-containing protein [Gemmatimonadota bacterium]
MGPSGGRRFLLLLALLGWAHGCRVAGGPAALNRAIALRFPSVSRLTTGDLAGWLARADTVRPVLLDVRAPEEFTVSHLAGARLAPSLEPALAVLAAAPADTPVVAYCSVGWRSTALAARLQARGYTRVYTLEGSLFQWANEGRPVYADAGQVQVVHPYGEPWSRFLDPARRAPAGRRRPDG